MSGKNSDGALASWYANRIGEPRDDDEVLGYWLFTIGVIVAILGIIVFAVTDAATTSRGVGYALAALAPPLVLLGAVVRFPLRRAATTIAGAGTALSIIAVAWFLGIFPGGWPTAGGDPLIIGLYVVGIALTGIAGAFIPILTDPIREDYERMQTETAETKATAERTEAEREELREELETVQSNLSETMESLSDMEAERDALAAELEAIRTSQGRFELYEDRSGSWRWRLRHRNGNVIASSGEGYSSRQKCQQGMHSVMSNALGAGVLRIDSDSASTAAADEPEPADADEPAVAVPAIDEQADSEATFELFEDAGGEWRWRLRHDNGNILTDSGEGYSTKSNAKRAMKRVREHVAAADYLRIDPVAFEIYRDRGGKFRWRLLHKNGSILGDSGQGYSSRAGARKGVESVRTTIGDAEVTEQ